jgi:hypothetical protein
MMAGSLICSSQYDLIENFPLIGHAIHVHRTQGAMINPWNIIVDDFAIIENLNLL